MALLIASVFIGLAVGFLSTFLSMGGGVLMVPLLPLFQKMNQVEAISTSLFVIAFVALAGMIPAIYKKRIQFPEAFYLAGFGSLLSALFVKVALRLPTFHLEFILLCVILFLFLRTWLVQETSGTHRIKDKNKRHTVAGFVGSLSGILSSLCGQAGGTIMGPVLQSLGIIAPANLAGTIHFATFFTAVSSIFIFTLDAKFVAGRWGPVHVYPAILIVSLAWCFNFVFSSRVKHLDERWRRRSILLILGLVFFVSLGRMLFA